MSLDAGASSSQGVGAGRHHQLSRQHQVPIVETASGCLPHSALMGLDPSMYGGRLGSGVLLGSDEEPDTRVHAHEVSFKSVRRRFTGGCMWAAGASGRRLYVSAITCSIPVQALLLRLHLSVAAQRLEPQCRPVDVC
jgi:hypothetical protein